MAKEILSLEDKFLKELEVLRKYSIRILQQIDKKFGVSRYARKFVLALGLKLITFASPNAQVSLHAQNAHKKSAIPELLAKATEAKESTAYEEFMTEHQDMVIERQKAFATALWEHLQENIYTIQEAEKKGNKNRSKALHDLFDMYKKDGIIIDKEYFCASAGLGSFLQTVDDCQFEEYRLIAECLTNPNNCTKIIKDFKANFGTKKESSDIQKALTNIYKKNPYAVCIVFPRSDRSRSGYHYVTVFSNSLAVDTLLTQEDSLKGKVARFNHTAISNTEDYFSEKRKRGYVFDISEMIGNYQIFEMFKEYLQKKEIKIRPLKTIELQPLQPISFQPFSQNNLPSNKTDEFFSWKAVGRQPISSEFLLAKNNQRII